MRHLRKSPHGYERKVTTPKIIRVNGTDLLINTNAKVIKILVEDGSVLSFIREVKQSIIEKALTTSIKRKIPLFFKEDISTIDFSFNILEDLKIDKMITSKAMRTGLLKMYKASLIEDYNEKIADRLMCIFEDGTLDELRSFCIWRDINIETKSDSFNSAYGHHTTTDKIATFYFAGKDREINVESNVCGTSWS